MISSKYGRTEGESILNTSDKEYVRLDRMIFKGKKNIKWDEVENYLKKYYGKKYVIKLYGDEVCVNWQFANEYVGSRYTKSLRGGLAKVKANLVIILPQLLSAAYNRRWFSNREDKHNNNASKGWYRYNVDFEVPVQAVNENQVRWNKYAATIIVRWNDSGLYLHDIINIKKKLARQENQKFDHLV